MNEYTINIPLKDYEELKRCEMKCNEYFHKEAFKLATFLLENGTHTVYEKQNEFRVKSNRLRELLKNDYWAIKLKSSQE